LAPKVVLRSNIDKSSDTSPPVDMWARTTMETRGADTFRFAYYIRRADCFKAVRAARDRNREDVAGGPLDRAAGGVF